VQLDIMAQLGERADAIRNRQVLPEEDNMLKVCTDGRKAALDLRLLNLPMIDPGKIEAAADRIADLWQVHREDVYPAPDGGNAPIRGSLQLVFCDIGTPSDDWNVYDELRDQLTDRGIPRESIRFVHDAKSDRDKRELFAACRAGTVAVLIGSTEKMGVGTNVQFRAIALHHLDCPWRPADVAQREGRILRQGNHNTEVQILRYVTERSFDGYMWQTVERKARFIAQVMRGRLDVREIEDIGDAALSYNEVKALATGNPLLMEKAEADAELTRLERAERAHHRNQEALQHKVAQAEQRITVLTTLIDDIAAAITRRTDTRGDAFTMTTDGIAYTKRTDAGRHLQQLVVQLEQDLFSTSHRRLEERPGELGGFPLIVTIERVLGSMNVILALGGAPGTDIRMTPAEVRGADPGKLIIRLENRLSGLESLRSRSQSEIDQLTTEATHARDDIAKPFPQAAQLAGARDRVARLEEKLRETAAPSRRNGDGCLAAAALHDTAAMAGIPGAASNGSGHQNCQPPSAAQVSRHDFPVDNPVAGARPGSGQVASKRETQAPRAIRHVSSQ